MVTRIFISYSHGNTALLEAFVDALRPVARQRGWEIWYDQRVTAGRHLDATIKAAIARSDVFLCFVSQAFLNSEYIREEELPRISEAVESRGALKIPVIVEDCFWKVECDGPRSVPLDRRGKLRPITDWSPRSKGHHAAAQQVIDGIEAHLAPPPGSGPTPPPPVPDDEPGPKIRRVADRFDVVDAPPPETERKDPGQVRQHELLCRRIERVNKSLVFYRDCWEYLCQEFDDYRAFASVSLDEIDLPSLIHAGNGLSAMVQASYKHDTTKTNTPALEPQVVALLEALLETHALFVSGFEEGRELRARAAENRLQGEDQKDVRDRTEAVLRELDRPADLLGPKAKKLVASSLLALENGEWTYRDLVETSAALAANGLIGMGREVAPWLGGDASAVDGEADEAVPVSTDAVPAAVTSAIDFFSRANDAVAAIAAAPDIRRFVTWIGEAAQTYTTRRDAGGEEGSGDRESQISSPPDFSDEAVHEMILCGEEIPDAWVDRVKELNFRGWSDLRDLAPLAKLTRLQVLDLSVCPISDLSPLSGLTALEVLACSWTLVTDLSPLSGLTLLRELNCSKTSVTDLSTLSGLAALRELDCSGTSVTDLSTLSGLAALRELDCSGTSVSDLSPLSGMRALATLDCSMTSVSDLSPLSGMRALATLDCSRTSVSDLSPLSGLTSLEALYCSGTPVSDLSPLSGLTALETLSFRETSVSDLSPLSGLRALATLDCSETSVSDHSPLSGLRALATLDCSHTPVSDLSPLSGLRDLEVLVCSGTSVTDLSPLSGLSALQTFDCSWTSVKDLSPVSGLKSLAALNASHLNHKVRWPEVWPASLRQLNLSSSSWPAGRPLPDVPWLIAPDGTVRRGEGEDPIPFEWWLPDDQASPPPPPEG